MKHFEILKQEKAKMEAISRNKKGARFNFFCTLTILLSAGLLSCVKDPNSEGDKLKYNRQDTSFQVIRKGNFLSKTIVMHADYKRIFYRNQRGMVLNDSIFRDELIEEVINYENGLRVKRILFYPSGNIRGVVTFNAEGNANSEIWYKDGGTVEHIFLPTEAVKDIYFNNSGFRE